MGDVDRVLRGRDLDVAGRAQHAIHEIREARLLASPAPSVATPLIGMALGVCRPLGLSMCEGIHPGGQGGKTCGLSEEGAVSWVWADRAGLLGVQGWMIMRWRQGVSRFRAILIQGTEHAPGLEGGCR